MKISLVQWARLNDVPVENGEVKSAALRERVMEYVCGESAAALCDEGCEVELDAATCEHGGTNILVELGVMVPSDY